MSLSSCKSSRCLLDLLIVLDASGSVRQRFQRQLDLIAELVDRLQIGADQTRVALLKYAGPQKARLAFDFESKELKEAIKKVGFIGGITYTNEALLKAEEVLRNLNGRRSYATSAVVVFTDGFSHEDPSSGNTFLYCLMCLTRSYGKMCLNCY
uniref:VWFA domain-containing protein n=1 Tax=Syphacia muris TaxID=451379 RepID=A0A0N5APT8_9BILA